MNDGISQGNDDKTGVKISIFAMPNVAEGKGRDNTSGETATEMKKEELRWQKAREKFK